VGGSEIELIISNNCSPDQTHEVIEEFLGMDPRIRYVRNTENIGSDNNFIQCFNLATGRFFLLLGDDDILMPGSISKILSVLRSHDPDIVYLSSSAFTTDYRMQTRPDPYGRGYRVFSDEVQFAKLVNMMFVFISCIIVNRDRVVESNSPPIELARGSALIQLSWILPLFHDHRSSVCIFERLLAGRTDNGGYFNIATVAGVNLPREASRHLGKDSPIVRSLISAALRRWFPTELYSLRRRGLIEELAKVAKILDAEFGSNATYWLFSKPMFWLPLWLARNWLAATRFLNKILYVANIPDYWRSRPLEVNSSVHGTGC
jgi:glycosyltransferase involved in cell wall biosynthesis